MPTSFQFPLRLGFGCSGVWGMRWFPEREAQAILLKAFEGGVRHVDTAGFYGGGEAERRLGAALKLFREPIFVSTKTGTRYAAGGARKDFSEAAIRRDIDASLKRLGRDRLDLLYLHGPSRRELEKAVPTLARLREEGKIERWGVCGEGRGLDHAIDAGADVVMGVYNILRRDHVSAFRRAKNGGLGVVAVAPLAQGLYAPDFFRTRTPADAWRIARAIIRNRPELARARALRAELSVPGWAPAGIALAFALAEEAIDVAVTTTTNPVHLAQSLDAARRTLPDDARRRIVDALTLPGEAPN